MADTVESVNAIITGSVAGLVASMHEGAAAVREGTESISASFEGMSAAVESAMAPLLAFFALLEGGELLKGAIEKTAEFGKQLEIGSQKMGIAAEDLSRLTYAANLSDVSFDQLSTGMVRLARNMQEAAKNGASPAAEAFTALGITVTDSAGHLRPMDQILAALATRFASMEDGTGKAALAMTLFGRAGADMIPLLDQGATGIAALEAQADKLGITMNERDVAAANRYVDTMKEFHAVMDSVERQIALAVMPTLESLAKWAQENVERFQHWWEIMERINPALWTFAAVMRLIRGQDLTSPLNTDPSLDASLRGPKSPAPTLPQQGGPSQIERWREEWNKIKEAQLGGENDLLVMEIFFWRRKLEAAKAGSKEYMEVHNHIVELEAQLNKRSDEEEKRAQKELQDRWIKTFEEIPKAWNNAVQSMRHSTASFGQFFGEVMREIALAAASAEAKIIIAHNATWLEKKKTMALGYAEEVLQSTWATIKVVANYAIQAAAAAWAAIAAIPYVGPFLAPAIAAGTLAAVLALASGGGGGGHPGGGSAAAPAGSGGGGATHNYYINAVDAPSFQRLMMTNASAVAKAAAAGAGQGVLMPGTPGRG